VSFHSSQDQQLGPVTDVFGRRFPVREPRFEDHGLFAFHDQRCAIEPSEPAVYQMWNGVFAPSWKAQKEGWFLVEAKSAFQRWLLQTFFDQR
jgi:hypothetical protein